MLGYNFFNNLRQKLGLDTGFRVQIQGLTERRQTYHSYSCRRRRSHCGHKQLIQDSIKANQQNGKSLIHKFRKPLSWRNCTLTIFVQQFDYYSHQQVPYMHICEVFMSLRPLLASILIQTSIEFLKFITGSEVEENKIKYVTSRFN